MSGQIRRVKIAQAKAVQSEATQFEVKNIIEKEVTENVSKNDPLVWSRVQGSIPVDLEEAKKLFFERNQNLLDIDNQEIVETVHSMAHDVDRLCIMFVTTQFPSGGPTTAGAYFCFYEVTDTGLVYLSQTFIQVIPSGCNIEYSGDGIWFFACETFIGDKFHRINLDLFTHTVTTHVIAASITGIQIKMTRVPGTNRIILSEVLIATNNDLRIRTFVPDGPTGAAFTAWIVIMTEFGGETISVHRMIAIRARIPAQACKLLVTYFRNTANNTCIISFNLKDDFSETVAPFGDKTVLTSGQVSVRFIQCESDESDSDQRGALLIYPKVLNSTSNLGFVEVVRKVTEDGLLQENLIDRFYKGPFLSYAYDLDSGYLLIGRGRSEAFGELRTPMASLGKMREDGIFEHESCSFEVSSYSDFTAILSCSYSRRKGLFVMHVYRGDVDVNSGQGTDVTYLSSPAELIGLASQDEDQGEILNVDAGPSIINIDENFPEYDHKKIGRTVFMGTDLKPTLEKSDALFKIGRLLGSASYYFNRI